jgi:ribonuclease HI
MEYILSQCEAPGQKEIWELAKELWLKRNLDWAWPGIGTIITSGLATFKNEEGKVKAGDARLYRLIMAESAYLIWKLRCERVIQNNGVHATSKEIHNRWVATMNGRLKLDCKMTDRMFEKKAIPIKKVLQTWKGILKGEDKLPDDWTGSAEVLVGIEPRRQQEE